MPEKSLSLLVEYRHWRASLPIGFFMLLSGYLIMVRTWPTLAEDPGSAFSEAAARLTWLASPIAVWILIVALSMLLGSWWGEVCSWLVARIQIAAVARLPLQRNCAEWSRWQRARLPIWPTEMRRFQNAMRSTPDYADLLDDDQVGAYREFMKEVFSTPYAVLDDGSDGDIELVRSVTDLRLLAGLLPWLPLSIVGVAMTVDEPQLGGFVNALWVGTFVVVAALLVSTIRQARATSSVAIRMACTPERLGRHARSAQGSAAG